MSASIRYIEEKFKVLLSDDAFFYSVLVILVGITAFGLGRNSVQLAAQNSAPSLSPGVQYYPAAVALPLIVSKTNATAESPAASVVAPDTAGAPVPISNTGVVVSKNGTKYHLPTCPGAKQIKEANLIRFASPEQARAAGYEPAKNCQF